MVVYHFSEDPAIERFVPHVPRTNPEMEPFVWAIDPAYQPVYFMPRNCPRVCFWPCATTTRADYERFWAYVSDRMVIAIEAAWFERVRTTTLYRYVFPADQFEPLPNSGNAYVSRKTVVPVRIEPLTDLIDELRRAQVELRICHSLVLLGRAVAASSLDFSMIRMRNAAGWNNSAV